MSCGDEATKGVLEEELQHLLAEHGRRLAWKLVQRAIPETINYCVFMALKQAKEGKFRNEAKFTTWFEAIVRRHVNKFLTEHILQRETEVELPEELQTTSNLDAKIELDEIRELLTEEERTLLELQLEHTDSEIAAVLGVGHAAVRKKWQRLREKIAAAQHNR